MKCVYALAVPLLLSLSVTAAAMQPLTDDALSQQSGQDGLTVGVNLRNSTLVLSQAGLVDTDGIAGTHVGSSFSGPAAMVFAPTTYSATQGVRFFNDVAGSTLAVAPVLFEVDAGVAAGSAALNIGISLPSDLRRIRINPFSLYMASAAGDIFTAPRVLDGAPGTLKAGVTKILEVGTQGIDIVFKAGDPVKANVQLGSEPQGHMLVMTGGSLLRIGNDASGSNPVQLMSKNTSNSSIKLDIDFTATDQVAGFGLAGFYGDITTDGLLLGRTGPTDKFNLVLGNAVAGTSGTQGGATVFNDLKNGSMGSVGLVGARVTDLAIKVRGL